MYTAFLLYAYVLKKRYEHIFYIKINIPIFPETTWNVSTNFLRRIYLEGKRSCLRKNGRDIVLVLEPLDFSIDVYILKLVAFICNQYKFIIFIQNTYSFYMDSGKMKKFKNYTGSKWN